MTDGRGRTLLALGTIYLVWGSTYLGIKIGLEGLPPLLLAGLRFSLAGGVMLAWAIRRHRRSTGRRLRPTARQWAAAATAGGLLLLGGNGAVTVAEQRIDSGLAALLVASVPLWMALFDRVRFGQRLTRGAVLGLALGFVGVGVLVRPDGAGELLPSLLVLGGAAAWAAGSLYSRSADLPDDPVASAALQMVAAAAMFLVLAVLTGEPARVAPASIGWEAVAAVAYLAMFGSVVAFTAYTWLLRNVPASTVGTYAYVNPVVAVLLGWLVLGEDITASTAVAAGLIVASVALIVGGRAGARDLKRARGAADGNNEPAVTSPVPESELAPTAAAPSRPADGRRGDARHGRPGHGPRRPGSSTQPQRAG